MNTAGSMSTSCGRRDAGAFSLLELLVVIALLSLTMAVGITGLAGADGRGRLLAAGAIVEDADRFARLLALSAGPVTLRAVTDPARVELCEPGGRVLPLGLPPGTEAMIEGGHEGVRFDRSGRCPDYRVRVRAGGRSVAWRVCGATGWRTTEGGP